MAYDHNKTIELYLLKAANYKDEAAPNQKKYYQEAAQWLEENTFSSADEMMDAMQNTEYYMGAAVAKSMDEIQLRINAMKYVGYDSAAAIYEESKARLNTEGYLYIYSPQWIEDCQRASDECEKYAKLKGVFGRLFSSYYQIAGNPQSEYRTDAVNNIISGLDELALLGTSFDELAADKVYRELTMATDLGYENFIGFIHDFIAAGGSSDDIADIAGEQEHLAEWVRTNKEKLISAGENENWGNSSCIAVPSGAPGGYDFLEEEVEK